MGESRNTFVISDWTKSLKSLNFVLLTKIYLLNSSEKFSIVKLKNQTVEFSGKWYPKTDPQGLKNPPVL